MALEGFMVYVHVVIFGPGLCSVLLVHFAREWQFHLRYVACLLYGIAGGFLRPRSNQSSSGLQFCNVHCCPLMFNFSLLAKHLAGLEGLLARLLVPPHVYGPFACSPVSVRGMSTQPDYSSWDTHPGRC